MAQLAAASPVRSLLGQTTPGDSLSQWQTDTPACRRSWHGCELACSQTLPKQPKSARGWGKKKGQGKGPAPNPPQGLARRAPNLKPLEDRATPTVVEIKCSRCQAYNWTTRGVCRSCQTPLARPQGVSNAGTQSAPASAKTSGTVPGKSYAQAAAGVASQSALSKRQAELETGVGNSTGGCERQAQRPTPAGSQARLGYSKSQKGHCQAGKGRRHFEASSGGAREGPTRGDPGKGRAGGSQKGGGTPSTTRTAPGGSRVIVLLRCGGTDWLLPKSLLRNGRRQASNPRRNRTDAARTVRLLWCVVSRMMLSEPNSNEGRCTWPIS